MKLAFVLDPLDAIKTYKDSSYAMMEEAARRGHELFVLHQEDILCREGRVLRHRGADQAHRREDTPGTRSARSASCRCRRSTRVLMRKDPPFDMEYVYSTYLLELAERQGARVINRPRALRDYNEKFSITRFTQFTVPTLVTRLETRDPRLPRRAGRHRAQAAGRHGRRLGVPPAPAGPQHRRRDRDADPLRAPHRHGAALHPGDRARATSASC